MAKDKSPPAGVIRTHDYRYFTIYEYVDTFKVSWFHFDTLGAAKRWVDRRIQREK